MNAHDSIVQAASVESERERINEQLFTIFAMTGWINPITVETCTDDHGILRRVKVTANFEDYEGDTFVDALDAAVKGVLGR